MKNRLLLLTTALALVGIMAIGKMTSVAAFAQEGKRFGTIARKHSAAKVTQSRNHEEQGGEDEMLTAPVTIDRAVSAALARTAGYANSAQLENENGTVVWSVDVVTQDGHKYEVKVDGASGSVISSKIDNADGGDEDRDGDGDDGDGESNDDGGR